MSVDDVLDYLTNAPNPFASPEAKPITPPKEPTMTDTAHRQRVARLIEQGQTVEQAESNAARAAAYEAGEAYAATQSDIDAMTAAQFRAYVDNGGALPDTEPALAELVMQDLEQDPRAIEALHWDALTDEEKADEQTAGQLLKALKAYHADETTRAKLAGAFAQPMEVLITNADAPAGVRKAMRSIYEREATAKADRDSSPTLGDARSDADRAFTAAVKGEITDE